MRAAPCCLQLTCRTYLRDFGAPESNSDDLAPLFRDELMPLKGTLHRRRSPLIRFSRVRCPVCRFAGGQRA